MRADIVTGVSGAPDPVRHSVDGTYTSLDDKGVVHAWAACESVHGMDTTGRAGTPAGIIHECDVYKE